MAELSADEKQKNMQAWRDWIKGLADKGVFLGGEPLGDEVRVVSGRKKVVTDGPFAESKEMVGGYLIVKAGNLDEATEISKNCPIYEVNGITEIREIFHMEM